MELERVNSYEKVLNSNLKLSNQLFSIKLNTNEYLILMEYLLNLPIETYDTSLDYYSSLKACYQLIYFTIIRWSELPLDYIVFKGPSVPLLLSFINTFTSHNFDSVQQAIGNFLQIYPNLGLEFKDFGLELSDYNWRLIKKVEKSNSPKNLEELSQFMVIYTKQQVKTLKNLELINNLIYTEFNLNNEELIDSWIYYYDILTKLILKNLFKEELVSIKLKLLSVIHSTIELKYFNSILSQSEMGENSKISHLLIDRIIEWLYQFPTPTNCLIGKDSSLFCDLEYYYSWSNKFTLIKDKLDNNSYYSKCEFICDSLKNSLRSSYQPYKSLQASNTTNNSSVTANANLMDNPQFNNNNSSSRTLTPPPVPPKDSQSQSMSSPISDSNDLLSAEQESLISQVKDLFPELGEGYIQVCLREFNYDLELTIMNILEGNLPNHIMGLDKGMEKIK